MKILIIAGHGAGDPGACACGYQEANLVREIAPILKNKLSAYAEVDVFDTSKNMYKYLKSNSFNFKNYNYVLELHFNAGVGDTAGNGKTTGTEVLVHPNESGTGVEAAILKNICALGFKSRGIKVRSNLQNMNICKGKQGVSYALLETCFIDDLDDIKLYQNNKDKVITAIANGIISGFNLGSTINTVKEEDKEMTAQEKASFEALQKEVNELKNTVNTLANPMIYAYIDGNTAEIADDANAALEAAMKKGVLKGTGGPLGLNLTEDLVRIHIWNYRMGLYD